MLFRICCVSILSLLLWQAPAMAQTDDGSLDQMRQQWDLLNQSMTKKLEQLESGQVAPGLEDAYRDEVDEANDLIEKMREQGMLELSKAEGEAKPDAAVIQTLLGIMVHDAQEGRDADVLRVGESLIGVGVNPLYFEKAASLDRLEMEQKRVFEELLIRQREAIADDLPQVKIETSKGEIIVELFENEAPNTVRNFISLVESGHYTDKLFHRVIDEFMAQTGGFESVGIGSGGPGYEIECECRLPDARRHFTGTLSMAHAGRDTGGSQFFITFSRTDNLDRLHTVFGRVISGIEILESIERTAMTINGRESDISGARMDKIISASVLRKRDHSYRVRKKGEPELPEEPAAETEKESENKDPEMDDAVKEKASEPEAEMKEEPKKEEPKKEEPKKEVAAEKDARENKGDETKSDPPEEKTTDQKGEKEKSGEPKSDKKESDGTKSDNTEADPDKG